MIENTSTIERAALAGLAAAYSLLFSRASIWANSKPPQEKVSPASLANA